MDRQTRKTKQRAAGLRGPKGAPFARKGLRDARGVGFFPQAGTRHEYYLAGLDGGHWSY